MYYKYQNSSRNNQKKLFENYNTGIGEESQSEGDQSNFEESIDPTQPHF